MWICKVQSHPALGFTRAFCRSAITSQGVTVPLERQEQERCVEGAGAGQPRGCSYGQLAIPGFTPAVLRLILAVLETDPEPTK